MVKVKVVAYNNIDGDRRIKADNSIKLIEKTLMTEAFKNSIRTFTSEDGKGTFHFKKRDKRRRNGWVQLKKYSNREILDKLILGNENNEIEFKIGLRKYKKSTTVGSTFSNGDIYTDFDHFDDFNEVQYAAHLIHEYCHVIGFEHSKSNKHDKLRDCYSVPYAIGNLFLPINNEELKRKCKYKNEIF